MICSIRLRGGLIGGETLCTASIGWESSALTSMRSQRSAKSSRPSITPRASSARRIRPQAIDSGSARPSTSSSSRAASGKSDRSPPVADPERRAACEQDLKLYLQTYHADGYYLGFSADHDVMIKRAEVVILTGAMFALAMPRGSGKTTICRNGCQARQSSDHRSFVSQDKIDSLNHSCLPSWRRLYSFQCTRQPCQSISGNETGSLD